LKSGDHVYFVHSFAMQCTDEKHVLATTEYGGQIAAIVGRDNLLGTQFHPEKSQATGISLLNNFLQWRP
jgi:glutamine amidotransferase